MHEYTYILYAHHLACSLIHTKNNNITRLRRISILHPKLRTKNIFNPKLYKIIFCIFYIY